VVKRFHSLFAELVVAGGLGSTGQRFALDVIKIRGRMFVDWEADACEENVQGSLFAHVRRFREWEEASADDLGPKSIGRQKHADADVVSGHN